MPMPICSRMKSPGLSVDQDPTRLNWVVLSENQSHDLSDAMLCLCKEFANQLLFNHFSKHAPSFTKLTGFARKSSVPAASDKP